MHHYLIYAKILPVRCLYETAQSSVLFPCWCKFKTRVTSCELQVQIYKFQVQIYELGVQNRELRVQTHEL